MRLSATILSVIAFLVAGVVAGLAARVAVATVEERSVSAVQDEIRRDGQDWARVLGDGLQVIIEGEAPSEAARFRTMSLAGGIVDASRVIDNIHVAEPAAIAPPDFAIEILRNDSGVSLIGLIPAATDRAALSAGIARIAGGAPVTDLLQTADYPVRPSWRASLDFGLDALERLPRSKISVRDGEVAVTAISDSLAAQRRVESELARRVPDGVRLTLNVTAPRPVISPFTIRFTIDERGPRFDACSADNEAERETILAAARAAGAEGKLDCRLGLGVPTRSWGAAVSRGIAALADIGGGTITFSDADVTLVAAEGSDAAVFDRVAGELSNALPDVFSLEAVRPVAPDAGSDGPPEFVVTLSPEGRALVRGRLPDALMNRTVASFARAQFGADRVTMGTRVAPDGLPEGWTVRVLTGIEALSMLSSGAVTVLPDRVTVTGEAGDATARDEIAQLFIDKLGRGAQFSIDVAYVEALDPLAGMPTPEECVNAIRGVTEGRKITFEPGSATLNADALPIMDDIAEVLRLCGDLRLRISGYTDSQGREETNLRLSQQRAESVLDALRLRRVPVGKFEAVGFGEADPIADNATEAGRETNRRIEFALIGAEAGAAPVAGETAPPWRPETRPRARPGERPDLATGPESPAPPEPAAEDAAALVPAPGPAGDTATALAPATLPGIAAGLPAPEVAAVSPPDGTVSEGAGLAGSGGAVATGPGDEAPDNGVSPGPGPDVLIEPPVLSVPAPDGGAVPAGTGAAPVPPPSRPSGLAGATERDAAGGPPADGSFVNAMDSPPGKRPRVRADSDDG